MTALLEELRGDCSSRVAKLLREPFFWDGADDAAPFGTETGADVLVEFVRWRRASGEARQTSTMSFLEDLLREWGVEGEFSWAETGEREIREQLEHDRYKLSMCDDAVVATAFAQLIVDGEADREVLDAAANALERQQSPPVVADRAWMPVANRETKIRHMLLVLKQAPAHV